jgi:hypothetical protein
MGNFFANQKVRMVSALLLALGFVQFITPQIFYPNSPSLFWNQTKVLSQIENFRINNQNWLKTLLSSLISKTNPLISLTNLSIQTKTSKETFNSDLNQPQNLETNIDNGSPNQNSTTNKVYRPAATPTKTATLWDRMFITPTKAGSNNNYNPVPSPAVNPTTQIEPTKTSKPTKVPKPTPTPTITIGNPRPGNNIREVAEIVGKIMCVPPAMIYAIYDNEAGYLGGQVNSNWTYYNTYQGSDPCNVPGDTGLCGVTQMMGDTWSRIKPYVAKKLGTDQISIMVTFDSMAAGAYHVGNISLACQKANS